MERFTSPSRRGFSARSILSFVLVVILTTLLWAIIGSQPAHAADASWSGDTIIHDNHAYTKTTEYKDTSNTIPAGATIYQTIPLAAETGNSKRVFILYFSPGVDPPTAKTANYVEFTYSASNGLSDPQKAADVSLTVKGEQDEVSSCSVSGIGWIICPVSVFLAEAMDNVFGLLSSMIQVQPSVLGDSNNGMYIAWNAMRNIANIAFVIAFLVIIYSQLTSFGVSNYGLKKLVPRLIIAAVLVNVSFIVSALAIDISNVLGYSIQNIFNVIRENLFHMTDDNTSGIQGAINIEDPWTQVTAVILAGGGVAGGMYYVAAGGLYMLIPLLLGLVLTLIFVVIVLAARQAIIVILVIISPIAFVANLLPNTEKWFDKWKDLFMTMLIFFPAFSLVFGGSQLAGQLIIQNAGANIVTVLFGMAVQIAPLVITPLLLKFSGSLLGRIAQIANNPSKGILDRNKNWATNRAEYAKQRNMDKGARWYNPASYGASMVRNSDFRKRRLQDRTNMYKQGADNKYHESEEYGLIHEGAHGAELDKQRIENQNNAHIQGMSNVKGSTLNVKTIELENAKVSAERANAQTAHMISGYRAGVYNTRDENNQEFSHLGELQKNMARNVIETAAWKQGEQNNQYVQQRNISSRMRSDGTLLDIAQGYGDSELQLIGRERAQAAAVATLTKLNKDARDNVITLMETQAVEKQMSVKDYAVREVFSKAASNNSAEREKVSRTQLEAALEIAAADGQVSVFDDARANKYVDQSIVDAVVARNVGNMKAKGGFHIQADPNLSLQRYIEAFNAGDNTKGNTIDEVEAAFAQDQKMARLGTLSNTTSVNLAGMKYGAFERLAKQITGPDSILDVIPLDANKQPIHQKDQDMVEKIFESLRGALEDPSTRASITDRLSFARDMEETLRAKFFKTEKPLNLSEAEQAVAGGGKRPASMADNAPQAPDDYDPTDSSPSDAPAPK
jgi:hypothetical protein